MKALLLAFFALAAVARAEPLLSAAIAHLYPSAIEGRDYVVQNNSDGQGPVIAKWDVDALGARPANQQIAAAAAAVRAERQAAAEAEAEAKVEREALEAKLEAGTITAAEQRALLKTLIRRVKKLEAGRR